jgi:hypothetical protein
MSAITKEVFKRCVSAQQAAHSAVLYVNPPEFTDEGFSTTASMASERGIVALRCGPSEYHVELFIHAEAERKRWTLVDLLALPKIRDWMRSNRVDHQAKQRIEAEVEYAFRLLEGIVSLIPELRWLRRE